jgi:hypothetical protein
MQVSSTQWYITHYLICFNFEYLFYTILCCLDLVLLDLSMRVEQVAAQYPHAHLILSADVSSLANSGFLIMRNTPFVAKLLER